VILRVDPGSAVPPYEQIRSQLASMIEGGTLRAGRRLPTIRQLASDLGLAGGTVARAYRELEVAGLLDSRGRHGSFVSDRPPLSSEERERTLIDAASVFAAQAVQAGADPRTILERALETLRTSTLGTPIDRAAQ
jgi:GntR family transcriptional regulator